MNILRYFAFQNTNIQNCSRQAATLQVWGSMAQEACGLCSTTHQQLPLNKVRRLLISHRKDRGSKMR